MKNIRLAGMFVTFAALLGACSGGGDGGASATAPMALQGVVHGGQAPIVGSAVTLRAASEQGLSNATSVATSTTDSNGNFNFSFTCPSPSSEMYITSTGGNPGGGANSAIHLMSILGPCGSLHGSATVNELTTVAAAYTLNGFIGPSGCDDCGGGLPTSIDNISGPAPGLPNAMGNAALLVSPVTGLDAPKLPTSIDCSSGSPPANCLAVRKLNTAANALAACVNSSGPTSAQCTQLFDCAVVGAVFTSSTACTPPSGAALPTDTLQAMLNIVRNPVKVSIPGIDDTSSRDVVFSPAFTSHFTDYTLSLNLTGGGLNQPMTLSVDGNGDVWAVNYNSRSVSEFSPNGVPLSGSGGFAVGDNPLGIAFDANGDAWVSSFDDSSLTVLMPWGAPAANSPVTGGGLNGAQGIALSPDGDVWVADFVSNPGQASRFTAAGAAIGSYGTGGNSPVGVAIDASGYVFVTNKAYNSVAELTPTGTLVKDITDGNLTAPFGVAVDPNGNLWVANSGGSSLTKVTLASDSEVSAATITGGGLNSPSGVAADAAGNVWVADNGSGVVSEFNNAGTALSPSGGFVGAGIYNSTGNEITPAVDPSGNVWFANDGNNSLTVFFGAAAPTRTPLVAALAQGFAP